MSRAAAAATESYQFRRLFLQRGALHKRCARGRLNFMEVVRAHSCAGDRLGNFITVECVCVSRVKIRNQSAQR